MVIVNRIAVVPHLAAAPFIYGIQHEGNFRAELLLSNPVESIRRFSAREADIALVPVSSVGALTDARQVSEYCIAAGEQIGEPQLVSNVEPAQVRRLFLDLNADPTAAMLAVWAFEKHWKTRPEYYEFDAAQLPHAQPNDAFLLASPTTDVAFSHSWDLAAEWKKALHLPYVSMIWVAHKEVDPDQVEAFQYALTYGLEHSYEALVESAATDPAAAYERLSRYDYIFNDQKNNALKKFWDLGLKVTPRANPG